MSATLSSTNTVGIGRAGVLTLLLAGSLVVLSTAIIAPALPAIQGHFNDDSRASFLAPLLVTAPALIIAIAAPFAGYFLDRFGRRHLVFAALLGFVLFGVAGAVSTSLDWILATRVGLGLCVAFLMTGTTTLVGDLLAPEDRAALLGRQMSFNAIVSLLMMVAGGALTELHWRAIFLIYLAPAPLLFMLLRFVPRDAGRQPDSADVVATDSQAQAKWFGIGALYALALLGMLFAMLGPTRTPFLVESRHGASAFLIALVMATFTLGMLPASLRFAWLRSRLSPWLIFALGFAVMAAGFATQATAPNLAVLALGMGIAGAGFGVIIPNLATTLLAEAPERWRGRLSGGLGSAIFLGQFLSPVFSQPLVQRFGIETTFLISAVMMVAVALPCLLRSARPPLR